MGFTICKMKRKTVNQTQRVPTWDSKGQSQSGLGSIHTTIPFARPT